MWYVYSKHLDTGREEYVGMYDTAKAAVHRISHCYAIDKSHGMEDEYYYFMKRH